jgi:uncharacterized protein with PIN domain
MEGEEAASTRFIVDGMLGKLAKWLLILGFDTSFDPRSTDDELLNLARKEKRTLLTRDRGLLQRARSLPSLFVRSEQWKEQVRQVLEDLDLRAAVRPFSRCLVDNAPLKDVPKARARNLVSAFVYEHADAFSLCPVCGRVYWPGTHFREMEKVLGSDFGL